MITAANERFVKRKRKREKEGDGRSGTNARGKAMIKKEIEFVIKERLAM